MLACRLVDEAALKPWFDKWHLVPGKPWQEALEAGLDASQTCAVFIGPRDLGPWENEELRSALDLRVNQPEFRVVPVLLPGAAKPGRDRVPRFLSRLTWVDFSGAQGLHSAEAFHDLVAGIRGVAPGRDQGATLVVDERENLIGPRHHPGRPLRPLSIEEIQSRRELLAEVKTEVASRLRQSLHSAVAMDLVKETLPQAVRRPWDVEVKIGTEQRIRLAPNTEIIQVFDQEAIAGKLLILGDPGAGKTTTLLQLTQGLVDRAEAVEAEPIPVLLNLSSWAHGTRAIANWLVAELRVKYGVRRDIGERWLEDRRLLPLLDGLDEVDPACLEDCVKAVNELQQASRTSHLVVCCRLAEYENCEIKLQLNGAVYLHSLTEEQIRHYLLSAACPGLWTDIQADPQFLELAKSPLLLSMMILVHKERVLGGQQRRLSDPEESRQRLFDMYVECMLSRPVKGRTYGRHETLHWLAWLAQSLRRQGQPAFMLERLQPTWLNTPAEKVAYRLCTGLLVALIFFLLNLSSDGLVGSLPEGNVGVAAREILTTMYRGVIDAIPLTLRGFVVTVMMGLVAGLFVALRSAIAPIETVRWSRARAWTGMALWLRRSSITAVKYGAFIGLIAGLVVWGISWAVSISPRFEPGTALATWGGRGQTTGIIFGVTTVIAMLLMARPSLRRVDELWDWPVIRSGEAGITGLIFGLAVVGPFRLADLDFGTLGFGALCGLGMGLIVESSRGRNTRPEFRLADGLIVGLMGWPVFGVLTWVIGALVLNVPQKPPLSGWLRVWYAPWLGIGTLGGLAALFIAKLRAKPVAVETPQEMRTETWTLHWRRWLISGVAAALASSVVCGLLLRLGRSGTVQTIAGFSTSLEFAFFALIAGATAGAMAGVFAAASSGAMLGALIGALTVGLSGPEIDRRTVPNQGIRRAAANAGWFGLFGGLILGSVWGLTDLAVGVLMTQSGPGPWDWVRFWLGGVLFLALLSALVPGAACIQHFALRLVLWCRGMTPWHYTRFLDHATERMFLQRVGGRYRFIHNLLRDHFGAMAVLRQNPVRSLDRPP